MASRVDNATPLDDVSDQHDRSLKALTPSNRAAAPSSLLQSSVNHAPSAQLLLSGTGAISRSAVLPTAGRLGSGNILFETMND